MGWLRKAFVMPLRRAWDLVAVRIHHNKRGRGIGMLYDDVQLCAYEDVQVMWTMLQHASVQPLKKRSSLSRSWCWNSRRF